MIDNKVQCREQKFLYSAPTPLQMYIFGYITYVQSTRNKNIKNKEELKECRQKLMRNKVKRKKEGEIRKIRKKEEGGKVKSNKNKGQEVRIKLNK